MKKAHNVLWTRVAEDDLLAIVAYVAEDDANAGLGILNRIKKATATLDRSTKRGRVVPELQKEGVSTYREMVIPPWRVIYKLEGQTVYVLCVVDGRRKVEDVLLERLLK